MKKEGLVFNYLYSLIEGDEVEVYLFVGDFVFCEIDFFVVLILVGVG